jgi:transcriptional regulator with XRE-family HTH domain
MLTMEQIEARRRRIRFKVEDLAAAAGCNPNTAGPALAGKRDPRHGTAKALADALVAEEIALRDHLLSLHPAVSGATPSSSPPPHQ